MSSEVGEGGRYSIHGRNVSSARGRETCRGCQQRLPGWGFWVCEGARGQDAFLSRYSRVILERGRRDEGDVGQVMPLPLPPLLGEEREKLEPKPTSGTHSSFRF